MDLPRTLRIARAGLDAKKFTAVELLDAFLAKIRAEDPAIGAFLHLTEKTARDAAEKFDRGETAGPLAGIPFALKDEFNLAGGKTTAGSKMLENYISPYDGTVVAKLRAAGAVILGKNNQDEFAMGGSGTHSSFFPAKNPWDPTRVPGGSSSGSAAAVAAGFALGALGTDTGGSVRQPAGFVGVAGLKPTYGRISRYGVISMASSFDTVAPFAADCRDLAMILGEIAGPDPRDLTTAEEPVPDFSAAAEAGAADPAGAFFGKKIGVPRELDPRTADGFDAATRAVFEESLKKMEAAGAEIIPVEIPSIAAAVAAYYILVPSEVSTNFARFDGIRFGKSAENAADLMDFYKKSRANLGPEVRRRILLGTFALSAGFYDAFFMKAARARTLVRREFAAALEKCDAILTPTSPTLPWKFGEKSDPISEYLADICTIPVSLAGLPGLSVPGGFWDAAGEKIAPRPAPIARPGGELPVGLQIVGRPFSEAELLRLGAAWEKISG